jgi:7-cyano-7-deazaguanine synthase
LDAEGFYNQGPGSPFENKSANEQLFLRDSHFPAERPTGPVYNQTGERNTMDRDIFDRLPSEYLYTNPVGLCPEALQRARMQEKAVVIISGGMDSTVLAYLVKALGYDLTLLSFNYGQRHKKELTYAAITAKKLGAVHHIVDLSGIQGLLAGSALTSDIDVPEGHYSADNMAITVVPNRNAIMLSIAYGHAVSIGATAVYAGVHAGDRAQYPDCRLAFFQELDQALYTANEGFGGIEIRAPFIEKTKADIADIGKRLSVPFEDTWSCYKGGAKHDGKCATCVERAQAMFEAGVDDPTEYEDPTAWKKIVADWDASHQQ